MLTNYIQVHLRHPNPFEMLASVNISFIVMRVSPRCFARIAHLSLTVATSLQSVNELPLPQTFTPAPESLIVIEVSPAIRSTVENLSASAAREMESVTVTPQDDHDDERSMLLLSELPKSGNKRCNKGKNLTHLI